jgi:hypothetical protein
MLLKGSNVPSGMEKFATGGNVYPAQLYFPKASLKKFFGGNVIHRNIAIQRSSNGYYKI